MSRRFKKILKDPRPKRSDVYLIVSQFLKDIGLADMDPKQVGEMSSTRDLIHNFTLARCWYGEEYNIRFGKRGENSPPKKPRSQYWISYNWEIYMWDPKTITWKELHYFNAVIPGTRDIFENENKTPSTQDIYNKIKEIENEDQITK